MLPLCTASVCPTKSGEIVDARAHVLITRFSFFEFMISILRRSLSSMYGPFLMERDMILYFVAFPRLRPRTTYLLESFFRFRVFFPSGFPQGDVGGRPPLERPSPPPSG